jgi:putative endonuclease
MIGTKYEKIAAEYLLSKGYTVRHHNYRSKLGEIDIVAQINGMTVFVEVKYRKTNLYGRPSQAVNYKKQQRIILTAKYYLRQYEKYEVNCRFDVIEILGDAITHIEAAF